MTALRHDDVWLSPEAYLEGEQRGDVRHEYLGGRVYAMAGASDRHNVISGNIFAALHRSLRGKPCRAYINDMKVRTETKGRTIFYYPDVQVACRKDEPSAYYKTEPKVIFEVLSRRAEQTDRREKYFAYTSMTSVMTYVIVEQRTMRVEIYRRAGERWDIELLQKPEDILQLPEIECTLTLEAIYEGSSDAAADDEG
jgi:Uma2 family endonuclease